MTSLSSALPVQLRWLKPPAAAAGVTWGVPWSKGDLKRGELAALYLGGADNGSRLPLQSRPAAYWPDGSIKWSLHSAVCPEGSTAGYTLQRSAGQSAVSAAFSCPWQRQRRLILSIQAAFVAPWSSMARA